MGEEKKIGFVLIGIETKQFAILENNYKKGEEITIDINYEFGLDPENRVMGSFVEFDFKHHECSTFMKIVVACHFRISDQTWLELLQEDEIIFPKIFLTHLCLLTVGTSRGIIFSKTENTILNPLILPTINVTKVVMEDASFPLKKES